MEAIDVRAYGGCRKQSGSEQPSINVLPRWLVMRGQKSENALSLSVQDELAVTKVTQQRHRESVATRMA